MSVQQLATMETLSSLCFQVGRISDPLNRIHRGLLYPFIACVVHYGVVTAISVGSHDLLSKKLDCDHGIDKKRLISNLLMLYSSWVFLWRLCHTKPPKASGERPPRGLVVYEYTWLCNVTLWQCAMALRTNRPTLAMAYCVIVGIDQMLWYIDLGAYALFGNFPIGVAKYLSWPENSNWSSRITCSHHLWTIPLILYGLKLRMDLMVLPLALINVTANIVLSRLLTPPEIRTDNDTFYLNANLSYAIWKDIKFRWLQIKAENALAYLTHLMCLAFCFNTATFGVLWFVCDCTFDRNGRPCT